MFEGATIPESSLSIGWCWEKVPGSDNCWCIGWFPITGWDQPDKPSGKEEIENGQLQIDWRFSRALVYTAAHIPTYPKAPRKHIFAEYFRALLWAKAEFPQLTHSRKIAAIFRLLTHYKQSKDTSLSSSVMASHREAAESTPGKAVPFPLSCSYPLSQEHKKLHFLIEAKKRERWESIKTREVWKHRTQAIWVHIHLGSPDKHGGYGEF